MFLKLQEIADIQVRAGDRDRHQHDREAPEHELAERNIVAFLRRNRHHDDIRGRADDRAVSAEARAQRQRPPHVIGILQIHETLHFRNERNHCRGERDVIDEGRCDTGEDEDEIRHRFRIAAYEIDAPGRESRNDARRFQSAERHDRLGDAS